MVMVSKLCRAHSEIVALELNPVVAGLNGHSSLEARALVG
jgi:hypothetical protein